MKASKIVDRIGLILTKPREGFDLIVVEGATFWEGLLVSIIAILGLSATTISYTDSSNLTPLQQFLYTFIGVTLLWLAFTFILSKVIQALYDVPGDFKEAFGSISYSLTTVILPVIFKLVVFLLPIMTDTAILIIDIVVGAIWYIWLILLIYLFVKSYYKLGFKQFLASIFLSLVLTGIIIAVVSVFLIFVFRVSFSIQLTIENEFSGLLLSIIT